MASLEALQSKYQSVLDKGHEVGLTVQNLNVDGEKLLLRGVVPSDHAKNALWDAVKKVDPSMSDLVADFSVQSGLTYDVVSGDTLSGIAERFYGDSNAYQKIFDANKDQLRDPDKIKVGQKLRLP